MIRRITEYVIDCDHPECRLRGGFAFCVHTREACEAEAVKQGWKPTTYRRWLCPECVKLAERMPPIHANTLHPPR